MDTNKFDKFFVPFETAKRLKEAGYPQEVDFTGCVYTLPHGRFYSQLDIDIARRCSNGEPIAAPTYHEVLSWLESKDYNACTLPIEKEWVAIVNGEFVSKQRYASRENALRLAIKFALDDMRKKFNK